MLLLAIVILAVTIAFIIALGIWIWWMILALIEALRDPRLTVAQKTDAARMKREVNE